MFKFFASGLLLAVLALAPVHPAFAQHQELRDCAAQDYVIRADKQSDIALTVRNECSDPIVVARISSKQDRRTVVDTVLPGQTETFLLKQKKAEIVVVEPEGAGDFVVSLSVQK